MSQQACELRAYCTSLPQAASWSRTASGPEKSYTLNPLTMRSSGAQHLPLVRHAWLVQELDEGALATAAAAAAEARSSPLQLCPRANACTRGAVQAALARGHSVRGWGVRSLEVLARWGTCSGLYGRWAYPVRAALARGHFMCSWGACTFSLPPGFCRKWSLMDLPLRAYHEQCLPWLWSC